MMISCSFPTPSPFATKEASLPSRPGLETTSKQGFLRPTVTFASTPSPVPLTTIAAALAPSQTILPQTSSAELHSTQIVGNVIAIPSQTSVPATTPTSADLFSTQTVEKVIAASKPVLIQSSRSPDGKWRAEVIRYDCVQLEIEETAYEVLKLVHLQNGQETILDTQLQYCGGLGAAGLGVEFWAPNSGTLYYTFARGGVPDGCPQGWWRPLVAYDVLSGVRENLALGPLSPNRKMLVFPREEELILWDLSQGEIGRLPLLHSGWEVLDIAWSPGGNELVYLLSEDMCNSLKSSVVQVNVPEMAQTEIMETASPGFMSVIYISSSQIKLFDQYNREWRVNLVPKP